MSADTDSGTGGSGGLLDSARRFGAVPLRPSALVGVIVLTYSYVNVLYTVTDVVGGSGRLLAVVVVTLGLATLLGRALPVRAAFLLAAAFLGGGFAAYLLSIPTSQLAVLSAERLASDTVALLTGLSVLRLTAADVWALAIVPGPVFLSWYLALRERYVLSVVAGGSALGLFVLTGDADTVTTLVGVVGGAAAVGLGALDRHGGSAAQLDALVVILAAMIVLSASVSVVPGGGPTPLVPDRGAPTMEANVVNADDRVDVYGSIRLSPKVRFTVESERAAYWQVATYDRYTGDGWIRTGNTRPYGGRLSGPPGESREIEQTVTARTTMSVLPAAWKPVEVSGSLAESARVTTQEIIRPGGTVEAGESYTVESQVPRYDREDLRQAGTDYPDEVRSNYLQLPASTADRVHQRSEEVAGDETTAYDKAAAIEEYLEANKRYSLSVKKPDGDVAEGFLFEMDAGYCVYFATTMVVMLRAQGVPARFATGYTPGQQVEGDERIVRGLNSHAWVEVYFPDVGWVSFDPTPSDPRERAEQTRLTEARERAESGVDTNGSEPTTSTPTEPRRATVDGDGASPDATTSAGGNGDGEAGGGTALPTTPPVEGGSATTPPGNAGGGILPGGPSGQTIVVGLAALVGLAAGARRSGVGGRLYRTFRVRYQGPRRDPEGDVVRAFERLETLLARRYRPRRPAETPRDYLAALSGRNLDLDDRIRLVGRTYERARYGRGVTREEADEVVAAVDGLARESTPLLGRLRRGHDDDTAAE